MLKEQKQKQKWKLHTCYEKLKVCISLNETYANIYIIQYTYINLADAIFCINHLDIDKKMLFKVQGAFCRIAHPPKIVPATKNTFNPLKH